MKTNVVPAEVERFDALAARWWDPRGAMRPLHEINALRLAWADGRAGLAGKRVLDVGCGGGLMAEGMATRGARVTGIDLADAALDAARAHAREAGLDVEYRQISAEALAETDAQSYDVVTCLELLEHVPDPEQLVGACARLAKPGGHVFFSTINRNPKAYALAVLAAEYMLGMLPRGTHDYARFIKPSELDGWARGHGLALAALAGLHYSALAGRWKLGSNVDVNYLAHYRAPDEDE